MCSKTISCKHPVPTKNIKIDKQKLKNLLFYVNNMFMIIINRFSAMGWSGIDKNKGVLTLHWQ